jgi:hypothetical protein
VKRERGELFDGMLPHSVKILEEAGRILRRPLYGI